MQMPLQITVRDIEHSAALDARIRDKATKLDELFDHIISCRVVIEVPHKRHRQGGRFNVRIDIGVPGSEIVVNRSHADDVHAALRDTFDAAKRRLDDYASKVCRDVKQYGAMHMDEVEVRSRRV